MGEEKVLVVLFGWMGAHTKHVQKYADWWSGFGCDTTITCGTAVSTFFPPQTKKAAHRVVKKMHEYVNNNPNCTIIFHGFSNGGGFVIAQVLRMLEEKNNAQIRSRVKFHVLDSQLDIYLMSGLRAFRALRLPIYINLFFHAIFPVIMLLAWLFKFYDTNMNAYTLRKTPTHVMYSTADAICKPHEIEYFIEYLRSHSIPTTSHKFHDSPHVTHFRLHPEEYETSVLEFLASNGLQLENARRGKNE